ncbi:MAG: hypothetical protein RL196_1562 [Actinomycetota bacterium]
MQKRFLAVLSDAPFESAPADRALNDFEIMPYGLEHIQRLGYSPLSARYKSTAVRKKIKDVIEHRLGFPVILTLNSLFNIYRSKFTLAILEHNALLALRLKGLPIGPVRKARVIVMVCWLAERLPKLQPKQVAHWVKLLNRATAITVWSDNQVEILESFGVERKKIRSITFGVSLWFDGDAAADRPVDVFAIGQDLGRDYKTFFDAVRDQNIKVLLACKQVNLQGLDIPKNVEVLGFIDKDRYRALLRSAKVVVVPTFGFAYPTGQTVALEGAIAGAAIVVSDSLPMRQYFEKDLTAKMPAVGDAIAMRTALNDLLGDASKRIKMAEQGQQKAKAKFVNSMMWNEVAEMLDSL